MKIVKCLSVDDELNAHLVLKNYLEKTTGFAHTAQCYHINDILAILEDAKIDLLFLDVNMPDKSGLDFLSESNLDIPVILTTAYADFALQSYDYGVLDYLLKPFSYERFLKSVQRYTGEPIVAQENDLEGRIDMKVDGKSVSLQYTEIIYAQSYGNYVKLFTDSSSFIYASTTVELAKKLPKSLFLRIHKSYIVNMNNIARYDTDHIVLKDNTYLPVGITYRREVLALF